jgi:hypothetical protein
MRGKEKSGIRGEEFGAFIFLLLFRGEFGRGFFFLCDLTGWIIWQGENYRQELRDSRLSFKFRFLSLPRMGEILYFPGKWVRKPRFPNPL